MYYPFYCDLRDEIWALMKHEPGTRNFLLNLNDFICLENEQR